VIKHTNNIILIRNAYSYDFGGGEKFPVSLAAELKRDGYNPLIISSSKKLLNYAKQENIHHIKGLWWSKQDWGGKSIILFPIYCLWELSVAIWYTYIILRHKASVVHPQSRDDFISATIAAKLLRKRVIWTDHADLKYVYTNLNIWYKNPVGKLVYFFSRYANTVTLVSESEKKLISQSIGRVLPKNYTVIRNGISIDPIIPHKELMKDEYVIFAATSRLVTNKGIGELISAFATAQKSINKIKLRLYGEGPEENKFREMAKGNKQIEFCGFPEDTLSRIAVCDVFVHPSYHEGFSLSLIEAAKLSLPIIACNVGGNPEIIENNVNGLLVAPKDIGALSQAMIKLAKDKNLRQKFGKAAHERFLKEFVLEKIVKERFVPLYEASLSTKTGKE
jgi:glycosyltransferase involved in cell wall biosynthesis